MDFFARQEDYRTRSRKFYRAFGLAVVLAVAVFYLAVTGCFLVAAAGVGSLAANYDLVSLLPEFIYGSPPRLFGLRPVILVTSFILAVILAASSYKTRAIKKGGGAYIAEALGGAPLQPPSPGGEAAASRPGRLPSPPRSLGKREKQLLNVVEEMAVASGLPCPRVYILPKERGLNAVTAGLNHGDAVLAVTRGALDHLDRDELQGVVAHEFAHILNGDYALNLTMAGWLYGLLFFHVQGRDMMEFSEDLHHKGADDRGSDSPLALIALPTYFMGLMLCVGGWLGKAAAEAVQAAFSREREYLADALAVQFTRNPAGLAGALKKIAGLTGAAPGQTRGRLGSSLDALKSKVRSRFLGQAAPGLPSAMASSQALLMKSFFIVSPSRADGLFSSHPPLAERILALDPAWDGVAVPVDLSREPAEGARELRLRERAELSESSRQSLRRVRELFGGGLMNPAAPGGLELPGDWTGALLLGLLADRGGPPGGLRAPGSAEAAALMGRSLERASRLYEKMAPQLRAAASDPEQVSLLVAAAFLGGRPELRGGADSPVSEVLKALGGEEAESRALLFRSLMADEERLPLLSLAAPALKALNPERRRLLGRAVKALVAADGRLDLFEVAARQVLKRHLGLNLASPPPGLDDFVERQRRDTVGLLSLLSHLGTTDPAEARAAFAAGMAYFTLWPAYELTPRSEADIWELSRSLDRLGQAPDKIKTALIMGAVTIVLHDGRVNPKEYELLRALAAALDIPLPL